MILCCGEALIDMLPRSTTDGSAAFMPAAGGAVFNTAIALGRLGADTGFWYGLSSDFFGDQLRASMTSAGVDFSTCPMSDRPTTLAFVTLVDGQARYAFYDENTAGRLADADNITLPVSSNALFFGGISLVTEPVATSLEALAVREAGRRIIMIDPNIRTSFIQDEAAYRNRLERLAGCADIVKVSDEDLAWWCGSGDVESTARQLLDKGVRLVLVTQGGSEALAITESAVARLAPPPVTVVDTVGAGDTFNAGALDQLQRDGLLSREGLGRLDEAGLEKLLSRASRAAAVTVSRAGANPPWASELTAT